MEGVEGLPTDEQLLEILSRVAASPRFVARCSKALEFCRSCCDGTTKVMVFDPQENIAIQFHVCDDQDCEMMAVQLHQGRPTGPEA